MEEVFEIHFGGPGLEKLTVCVLGRKYPESNIYYAAQCLSTKVEVTLHNFQAEVLGDIGLDEVSRFYNDLKVLFNFLKGTASFRTLEGWLQLDVSADKLGHIEISGSVSSLHIGAIKSTLQFQLDESDQTYLAPTLHQLEQVVSHYR